MTEQSRHFEAKRDPDAVQLFDRMLHEVTKVLTMEAGDDARPTHFYPVYDQSDSPRLIDLGMVCLVSQPNPEESTKKAERYIHHVSGTTLFGHEPVVRKQLSATPLLPETLNIKQLTADTALRLFIDEAKDVEETLVVLGALFSSEFEAARHALLSRQQSDAGETKRSAVETKRAQSLKVETMKRAASKVADIILQDVSGGDRVVAFLKADKERIPRDVDTFVGLIKKDLVHQLDSTPSGDELFSVCANFLKDLQRNGLVADNLDLIGHVNVVTELPMAEPLFQDLHDTEARRLSTGERETILGKRYMKAVLTKYSQDPTREQEIADAFLVQLFPNANQPGESFEDVFDFEKLINLCNEQRAERGERPLPHHYDFVGDAFFEILLATRSQLAAGADRQIQQDGALSDIIGALFYKAKHEKSSTRQRSIIGRRVNTIVNRSDEESGAGSDT